MELDWEHVRWLQNAYDVSDGGLATPLPAVKAALSLLDGQDERPVIVRSSLTDDAESWTVMVLDGAALVHVRALYQPTREAGSGREDAIEDDVQELQAVRIPLRDVRAAVTGVPAAQVSRMNSGRTLQWRTNFTVSAPDWGIEESFEVSRMRQEHGRTTAETFLTSLVVAQSAR